MAAGETFSLTGKFLGETHRVLNCTQTYLPANQQVLLGKGQNLLVGREGSDGKWDKWD